MDMRPQGKATRNRSSSFDLKLHILLEHGFEVSNTSAFLKRREIWYARGVANYHLDPPLWGGASPRPAPSPLGIFN